MQRLGTHPSGLALAQVQALGPRKAQQGQGQALARVLARAQGQALARVQGQVQALEQAVLPVLAVPLQLGQGLGQALALAQGPPPRLLQLLALHPP